TNEEPQNVHREEGQRASVSTPMVTSRVLEEDIASPVELAKAYMASRPYKAVRSLEKGDSPRLLSYPLNEPPLKLPVKPPHKKRAFRTSVPGSDSALAADIVATSTLPGVSITLALVEPPQKKYAFQMSAPEDDSFEIDDDLAADIVATSTLLGVSLTPALDENNKQMFPKVVKVLEQAEPKALELTRLG
nr:hypothetical protein [Tanacetum cinerariifolium]